MKPLTVLTSLAFAAVIAFASPAHAWNQPSSTTSTTCPPKTTTTRAPSTTTSVPSTTSTSEPTSSSTTYQEEPSSTTSTTVEETTTTTVAETTTTTVAPTTTTVEATTTTVPDDVELIPPIFITSGDITELPATGFPYANVALFGIGVLCLGFAGELLRKMASR